MAGQPNKASTSFDLECTHCDKFGHELFDVTLEDVSEIKNSNYNLFSLTRLMQNGWKMSGDETAITMKKGGKAIKFDIVIPTKHGAIYAGYFKRKDEVSGAAPEAGTQMNIEKAHQLLGHCSEATTRKMAKVLEWTISRG